MGADGKRRRNPFSNPATCSQRDCSALALTEKFLLLGLNSASVNDAIQRLGSTEPKLGETPAFRAAEQSVGRATSAYGYLDLRGLFERFYGTFRPILAMSLAFMPAAGEYVDASKLPSTEAISRHLGNNRLFAIELRRRECSSSRRVR